MTTMTHFRPPVKPATEDASGTARMLLTISGTDYRARPIPCDPHSGAVKAFRLTKQAGGGEVYDVAQTEYGTVECDCPDWTFRREGTGTLCKHGAVLVAFGMLSRKGGAE